MKKKKKGKVPDMNFIRRNKRLFIPSALDA